MHIKYHMKGCILYKYVLYTITFYISPSPETWENLFLVHILNYLLDLPYNDKSNFANLTDHRQLVNQFHYMSANYVPNTMMYRFNTWQPWLYSSDIFRNDQCFQHEIYYSKSYYVTQTTSVNANSYKNNPSVFKFCLFAF